MPRAGPACSPLSSSSQGANTIYGIGRPEQPKVTSPSWMWTRRTNLKFLFVLPAGVATSISVADLVLRSSLPMGRCERGNSSRLPSSVSSSGDFALGVALQVPRND